MFKKEFKGQVQFLDKDRKVLKKEKLTSMPIRHELVIALSINKFNDKDPCVIHQTYCRNYICLGIIEEIN